jgi:BirA family transcriptional regulator, biotin operon repressor / biotin---[acetyl-CoA-carboxylase] ligase
VRGRLGLPRVHYRVTTSTNDRARELAAAGARHGTLVTADEQTAGRGRQGRAWSAPAGQALLMSLVLRQATPLLTLAAGVAVADVVGPDARIKWPNDVLSGDGRKVAGILCESRPQEGWVVLGIGVNVAVGVDDLPVELRASAGSMGLAPERVPETLQRILAALERLLGAAREAVLDAWRERDALYGRRVTWAGGSGTAAGIDEDGRLVVSVGGGAQVSLEAAEVHLTVGRGPRERPRLS